VDLFAGAGGWSEGLRMLGHREIGIEWDEAACLTARAAGHERVQADVAELDPLDLYNWFSDGWRLDGQIASPPCPPFSNAGKRQGEVDKPLCVQAVRDLAEGRDTRAELLSRCQDKRSLLVAEPMRWIVALKPRWIALEQVEPVLELWEVYKPLLERMGYSVWTGVLCAANYGVPQTRERAILMASLDRKVGPPPPTHSDQRKAGCIFGLEPWITMAAALGWGMTERPSVKRARGAWLLHTNRGQDEHGNRQVLPMDRPAPALTTKSGGQWVFERPSTTVCGDPRIPEPGWRGNPEDYADGNPTRSGDNAIRVTIEEALILQSFRPDYPVQGNKGKKFQQVGNAVPPLLARAVLAELVDAAGEARKAA
jgi:DNA (cytosine-5)-methyltransferase 1